MNLENSRVSTKAPIAPTTAITKVVAGEAPKTSASSQVAPNPAARTANRTDLAPKKHRIAPMSASTTADPMPSLLFAGVPSVAARPRTVLARFR